MTEFDTKATDEITCPYCGYEMTDSWEIKTDTDYTCDECGKNFDICVNYSVEYSTYKKECKEGKHEFEQKDSKFHLCKNEKEAFVSDTQWKYYEIFRCKNCEKVEYREISKEEFIKKYPRYYEWMVSRK